MDSEQPIVKGLFIDPKGHIWQQEAGSDPTCINPTKMNEKMAAAAKAAVQQGVTPNASKLIGYAAKFKEGKKQPLTPDEAKIVQKIFKQTVKSTGSEATARDLLQEEYRSLFRSRSVEAAAVATAIKGKGAALDYFLSHPACAGRKDFFRAYASDSGVARLKPQLLQGASSLPSPDELSDQDVHDLTNIYKRFSGETPLFSNETAVRLADLAKESEEHPEFAIAVFKEEIRSLSTEERSFLRKTLQLRSLIESEGAKTNQKEGAEVCLDGYGASKMVSRSLVAPNAFDGPTIKDTINNFAKSFEFLYQHRKEILTET